MSSSYADNLHDPTARRGGSSQNNSTYCAGPGATACGGGGVQDDGSGDDGAIALVGNNNEGNKFSRDISSDATSSERAEIVVADESPSPLPNEATTLHGCIAHCNTFSKGSIVDI